MRIMVATKREDPNYSQVSGYVPKELALKFRIACTAQETSQSDALEKAIALWLQSEQNQPQTSSSKDKGVA